MGSVLGAPVLLRPSWFVIAGVVTIVFAPNVVALLPEASSGVAYLVAGTFAVLLLGSVFLHELAHALAARAVGSAPSEIVLDLWGGHTAFSAEMTSPARSIVVAAVGPVTNAVLAVVGVLARTLVAEGGVVDLLLLALALSNGFVAIFNALPGLPLDGGRVLEGVVWAVRGNRASGSLVAGWSGRAVAVATAFYAVVRPLLIGAEPDLTSMIWLLMVAALLWQGATQAIRAARWRRQAPLVTVRSLLRPAASVAAAATVADAVVAAGALGVDEVVVLDLYGRPTALLDRGAVSAVPPERAPAVPVTAVARALDPEATLADDLVGDGLVERLRQAPHPEYVVTDAIGQVLGVLSWQDVATRLGGR